MTFVLEPDLEVTLTAIPGELFIEGIDSNYAVASMEVKCPRLSGPYADHFQDLEFDISRSGNKLTIGANKGTLFRGNSAVRTTISLPRVDYLKVKIRVQSSTLPSAVSSGRTELRPKGGPGFGTPQRGEVYRRSTNARTNLKRRSDNQCRCSVW